MHLQSCVRKQAKNAKQQVKNAKKTHTKTKRKPRAAAQKAKADKVKAAKARPIHRICVFVRGQQVLQLLSRRTMHSCSRLR